MPKRDRPQPPREPGDVDPEHDFTYGGDMQHDDPDEDHEEASKGGRPPKDRQPEKPEPV